MLIKNKKMIIAQIISFAVSSIMICFSPFCSYDEGKAKTAISIIISSLFWILFPFFTKKEKQSIENIHKCRSIERQN